MQSFFFRYHIKHGSPADADAPTVVVVVDQQEASARQRLQLMYPTARVLKLEQTLCDADCKPAGHPAHRA
jgi:hypothetical protein